MAIQTEDERILSSIAYYIEVGDVKKVTNQQMAVFILFSILETLTQCFPLGSYPPLNYSIHPWESQIQRNS